MGGEMQTRNGQELIDAHRNIETPFKLGIVRDGKETGLIIHNILRLLPGKRIVAVAECDDQEMLVKAYLGRTASRYAARESCGVEAIAKSSVSTPELFWRADLVDGKGEVLAFRYLRDAASLYQRWEEADSQEARTDILRMAVEAIGKLHNHGVIQQDLHLANFLLADDQLYTIDGGEVCRRSASPLSEEDGLKNLGLFFAQFYPRHDHLAGIVLPAYEAIRRWDPDPARAKRLQLEIARRREVRKRDYIQKAFRDCTRFACQASLRRFQVCKRNACDDEVAAVLANPEAHMAGGKILKDGNTATVALVQLSDRSLVIKRYNIKNPWHGLRRAFRKSRAWISWSNAWCMEFFGIPALKPVAMIENRLGPLRGTAWLVTEYIEGPDALARLREKDPDDAPEALASILCDLSRAQISHGDLKATNFLMAEEGPVIIDLDAMREYKNPEAFQRAFGKDLDRFMQNWEGCPDLIVRFDALLNKLPGYKPIS